MNSLTDQQLLRDYTGCRAESAFSELVRRHVDFVHSAALRVETESDFRKQLQEFRPGLILADYSLPHYDGLSALVVAQEECPEVPFILVSGTLGEETAIEALKHGAKD